MREPYRPKARCAIESLAAEMQADIDKRYEGVETEIVNEGGFWLLKVYVDGEHIGGLQQLPDAMKERHKLNTQLSRP